MTHIAKLFKQNATKIGHASQTRASGKALEFLIKDYSILNNDKDKAKIEKMSLGNCIKTYINDTRIKSVAKRAVWIGNDETHYVRRWEGKNLEDLKKLIELTIHWIEMEKLTQSFEDEMPE